MMPPFVVFPTNRIAHFVEVSLYLFYLAQQVNLVNLGYADKDFSTNERKIVEYLINKWSIPKEIYIEFVDIAETILSLIQEREWTRKTFALGSERDKKEQNIEKDIKKLKKDVDLTIEELTM